MWETEDVIADLFGIKSMITLVEFAQGPAEKFFSPLHPLVDIVSTEQFADLLFGTQDPPAVVTVQAYNDDAAWSGHPGKMAKPS